MGKKLDNFTEKFDFPKKLQKIHEKNPSKSRNFAIVDRFQL